MENVVISAGSTTTLEGTINVTGPFSSDPNSTVVITGGTATTNIGNIAAGSVFITGPSVSTVNFNGVVQAVGPASDALHIGSPGSAMLININNAVSSAAGISIQGSALTVASTGSITANAGSVLMAFFECRSWFTSDIVWFCLCNNCPRWRCYIGQCHRWRYSY